MAVFQTFVDNVLQRVRDPGAKSHTRAFALTILTHAQRFVNSVTGSSVSSTSLTTSPQLLVYSIKTSLASAIRTVDVVYKNKSLSRETLDGIKNMGPYMIRTVGTSFKYFIPIGSSLLMLWPGLDKSDTVTVYYIDDPTVASERDTVSVKPENHPLVQDLAEVILLLKQRDLPEAQAAMQRAVTRFEGVKNV